MNIASSLTMRDIYAAMVQRRRWFALATLLAVMLAIAYIAISDSKFEATLTVVRNDLEINNELNSFSTSVLGFAGFSTTDIGPFELFLDTIRSVEAYERLYEESPELVHELLNLSDYEREHSVQSLSVLSPTRYIHKLFGLPVNMPIDGARIKNVLDRMIAVEDRADIVRINVEHEDRALAISLLSGIVHAADEIVREGYEISIKRRVDFISQYLEGDVAKPLIGALSRRQQSLLSHFVALKVDGNYSFHVVSGPTAGTVARPPPVVLVTLILLATTLGITAWLSLMLAPRNRALDG